MDSYRSLISHSGGDRGAFAGIGWYRKHFKLPAVAKDGKVFLDFEVVDAQGNRCPTDEARVDFAVHGSVIWRGGLNSALVNSTNNLYLNTECGINRVFVRSTLMAGAITVTAARAGLTPATVKIESKPVEIIGGLTRALPPTLPVSRGPAK